MDCNNEFFYVVDDEIVIVVCGSTLIVGGLFDVITDSIFTITKESR